MSLTKRDLLITPCTSRKKGRKTDWPERRLRDFLGSRAARVLRAGRTAAYNHPKTKFYKKTPRYPKTRRRALLDMYSGHLYSESFKALLRRLINQQVHHLILTGGFGLAHPQERKRTYDAHLPKLAPVWRHRLPVVLEDYIARNGIKRVFIACSQSYARILSSGSEKWASRVSVFWYTPRARPGRGNRASDIAAQSRHAIRALAKSGKPDKRWKRGPKPDLS